MEQLTREERIARIRKMHEERRQAFLEWKMPNFLKRFNLQKKEEEVKEEPVVEEAPKKKRGRKKKEALDE